MYPIICKIGPLTIYSYGLMLAVSVFVCSYLLSREAEERFHIKKEIIYDLVFWSVVGGMLGARLLFVILHLHLFLPNPLEIIMIQKGGLSFQGGLIIGAIIAVIYIQKKKLPLWQTVDMIVPYMALGQAIGRIGCFLNGCCFGRSVVWGIYFPVHAARLHPTQLYDVAGLLLIFLILKRIQASSHLTRVVPGRILAWYLVLASLERFIIEFFRGDHPFVVLGLSIYQLISLVLFILGLGVFIFLKKFSKKF